jgi:hypothetical protein
MDKRAMALRHLLKSKTALEQAGAVEYAIRVDGIRNKYQRESSPFFQKDSLLRSMFGNVRSSELTRQQRTEYENAVRKRKLGAFEKKKTLSEEIFGKRYSDLDAKERTEYMREWKKRKVM